MLYWLTRAAQRLAGMLPHRVRWWIGSLLAQAIYWLWPAKRRATQRNMSIVLGLPPTDPRVRRVARLSWRNYGRYIGDFFDLPNHPTAHYLADLIDETPGDLGALDSVDAARALGRGVFIPTGHYGNWDVAGMLVAARRPIYAIAEAFADPRMNQLIQSQREAVGLRIVLTDGDALRAMLRVLRDGEALATPVDRPLGPGEGIPITFFGRTAYVPRGLGALVAKVGAVILPGFAYYDVSDHTGDLPHPDPAPTDQRGPARRHPSARRGRIHGYVFPPVIIERGDDPATAAIRATQAMFDALEVMVRRDPTQWYMFRPFWPDAEPVAPAAAPQAVMVEGGSDGGNL